MGRLHKRFLSELQSQVALASRTGELPSQVALASCLSNLHWHVALAGCARNLNWQVTEEVALASYNSKLRNRFAREVFSVLH